MMVNNDGYLRIKIKKDVKIYRNKIFIFDLTKKLKTLI